MSSAVLVQTKGWERSFQPLMKARILVLRSLTDLNTPRRMAWRSRMPNQISTRFIQEAWVGVTCTTTRGVGGQPGPDLGVFVGGVVVHHQVQRAGRVGPGDLAQEGEELLVPVPGFAGRGDLPGGDLQRREQG